MDNTAKVSASKTKTSKVPSRTRAMVLVCLYTLTILAVIYTAYLAQNLILLLLVAGLVSLLLSPGVKALERLFVPRALGATFLLACLVIPSTYLLVQLQEPVTKWAKMLPELSGHVTQQIDALNQAMEATTSKAVAEAQSNSSWFSWFDNEPIPAQETKNDSDVIETQLKQSIFTFVGELMVSAPLVLVQLVTTLILILFTLVYCPKLFRHYVKLFVTDDRQNKAYEFALHAQKQLSRYILTVSFINSCLAILAIALFSFLGLEDAILLGLIVGFVNFIPFVGPSFALVLISIAGFVQWGPNVNVAFALGGVLLLNILESQFITPLVLAKNMRINPFLIIIWLLITGWLWGLIGILIAVPLIVCIKLVLSQFERTSNWVTFLST